MMIEKSLYPVCIALFGVGAHAFSTHECSRIVQWGGLIHGGDGVLQEYVTAQRMEWRPYACG
jgi:hypothetical protein